MTKPRAPAHLAPATRSWWSSVLTEYAMEEHHVRLLTLAGEAYDRGVQARERIALDGLVVPTNDGGLKAHPCIAIERDCRLAFARLLRELDLDCDAPREAARAAPRPPALVSNRG
jgi:phage terminase small subunit